MLNDEQAREFMIYNLRIVYTGSMLGYEPGLVCIICSGVNVCSRE
jgi:hypothetical protein